MNNPKCPICNGDTVRNKKRHNGVSYQCKLCSKYHTVKNEDITMEEPTPDIILRHDLEKHEIRSIRKENKKYVKHLIEQIAYQQKMLDALKFAEESDTYAIPYKLNQGSRSESVAHTDWSDWHVEEEVKLSAVNGLNKFNLDIARQRVEYLANRVVRFVRMYRQDTDINTIVIKLLGDFITGNIHEDNVENALLSPIDAMLFAQELLLGGIDFIQKHLSIKIEVVCVAGNHPRITKKQRKATEMGNSLEYFMYHNMAKHYANNDKVTFHVSPSSHFYLDNFGLKIRCCHGHQIRYCGGVGGLLIPMKKKVAEWDKAIKADLNCFGHFHQEQKGNKIIVNGSLIGYNKYALDGGFEYEPPKQSFYLVNSKRRAVTIYSPILL